MRSALKRYELGEPVGRGAFGTVYAARHRATGRQVAIKVLSRRAPAHWEAEVHALARLDHPHILRVFDVGIRRHRSGDRPWFAMEWMPGQSMLAARGQLEWGPLRQHLIEVLAGLAHAHAAGLLHLDIKPENVLFRARGQQRWAVLADFGLAHELASDALPRGGTPQFMAPEQRRRDRFALGPWTDVYAVGGLALCMLGADPTAPDSLAGAPVSAPPALAAWIARSMAADPAERWPSAADALHALAAIDGQGDGATGATATLDPEATWDFEQGGPPASGAATGAVPMRVRPPPFPAQWRVPRSSGRDQLGAALFAMREPPLVGREAAAEAIGRALARVHAERRPRAVLLEGPPGAAKSQVARWAQRRAVETGAAVAVAFDHGPASGERALVRGVERWLGARDADERERAASASIPVAAEARRAAVRLIEARHPAERRQHLGTWLAALTRQRPAVVLVDDAHHAEATLARLGEALGQLPVLLLATAEGPVELPAPCTRVAMDPPTAADLRELAHRAMPLDARAASALVERAGGSAGALMALMREASTRRALRWAGDRWTLAADVGLPEDQVALWRARLAACTAEERRQLAVAALVGPVVHEPAWAAAMAALGEPAGPDALAELAARGLIRREAGRWRLAEAGLREAVLVERADLPALHRALATVVDEPLARAHHLLRAGELAAAVASVAAAARRDWAVLDRARLRQAEGLLDEAVAAGADSPEAHALHQVLGLLTRQYEGDRRLLAHAEAVELALAEDPALHPWWCRARVVRAFAARAAGELKLAEVLGRDLAERVGPELACTAWMQLAHTHQRLGEVAAAQADLARAAAHADPADLATQVAIGITAANIALVAGDREACRRHGRAAVARAEAADMVGLAHVAHTVLGVAAHLDGALAAAEQHYRAGRAQALRWRLDTQVLDGNLATLAVDEGRYADARLQLAALLRREDLQAQTRVNAHAALLVCEAAEAQWAAWPAAVQAFAEAARAAGSVDVGPRRLLVRAAELAGEARAAALSAWLG